MKRFHPLKAERDHETNILKKSANYFKFVVQQSNQSVCRWYFVFRSLYWTGGRSGTSDKAMWWGKAVACIYWIFVKIVMVKEIGGVGGKLIYATLLAAFWATNLGDFTLKL